MMHGTNSLLLLWYFSLYRDENKVLDLDLVAASALVKIMSLTIKGVGIMKYYDQKHY